MSNHTMKKFALTLSRPILLLALAGGESRADRLIKDQIALLEEMADAYDSNAPQATINEIKKRMDENDKRLEDLKLTEDAKRKFVLKHKAELDQATERVNEAKKRHEKRTEGKLGNEPT